MGSFLGIAGHALGRSGGQVIGLLSAAEYMAIIRAFGYRGIEENSRWHAIGSLRALGIDIAKVFNMIVQGCDMPETACTGPSTSRGTGRRRRWFLVDTWASTVADAPSCL